jgi:DNA-binding Lrp family transcriptional regulator
LLGSNGLAKAFILINTDTGAEEEVLSELKKIPGVTEAYTIYGVYDLIAKVEADTLDKVKEIVSSRIRRLEHVRSTLSMMVVEP